MTALDTTAPAREQSRARYPDETGYITRDGVRVFWERYGSGSPTVLLLPTWTAVYSRLWKAQIPYLARHCRVLTFDGRGNGRSDRPVGTEAYAIDEFAADALAVMDASGTERAALVSESCGALWATVLAADFPDRVDAVVYICPATSLARNLPDRARYDDFEQDYGPDVGGWALYNRHAWLRDYPGFLEFFFGRCFSEPHSTKQIEDAIGWALETTPETLIDATRALRAPRAEPFEAVCARVRCPTTVIHSASDRVRPHAQGAALAAATGGRLVTLEGCGHLPEARDPVRLNLLLRDLLLPPTPPSRWVRAGSRPPRALYVSSPIGLGHARRDLAIARELRALRPDLQIDWLAQDPVTRVLEAAGERIHPASLALAGESAHFQSESSGQELHCFQALRRMDEILVANFMVFLEVAQTESYDLWIGDEAWDLDYYLHENPELKSAAYVWLTDFVGYLPVRAGGDREAALTADLNAEMIGQIERFPRIRDRSIFVGEPDDVAPGTFGPGLPSIREWTEAHYDFAGYITGFDPARATADRDALRAELGYRAKERVCVVTVGGSGVGSELLTRAIESYPQAQERVPGLRMVVVTGPRIDPGELPTAPPGVELRTFVPDLPRHLAACDLAIVQGGLATTMELTAYRRPFLYVPLRNHFEQTLHVAHRLERHRAGRRLDVEDLEPGTLARAIAEEIGRDVDYLPVPADGAARAARRIAELLPGQG